MKKIFAAVLIALISTLTFTGCGNVGEAAKKDAETMMTDASESVSKAAEDMLDNTNGDISDDTDDNGKVSQN